MKKLICCVILNQLVIHFLTAMFICLSPFPLAAQKKIQPLYEAKIKQLANGDTTGRWPPAAPIPSPGALLPFNRVVAYYGNFLSSKMGILGEYDPQLVLKKLKEQAKEWELADPSTPVIPAIHYIAVTAQSTPCDGKYRLRMAAAEIKKAIAMADSIHGIVFLDIQVGRSTLQAELPLLEKYLQLSNVHLAIDPEFSMKDSSRPGTVIGSYVAEDVNYASSFLSELVQRKKIPPKILVVHRFTAAMLKGYKNIHLRSDVQVVINMDGFGPPALKKSSYHYFIFREPVQFAGFKIFYKNDTRAGAKLMKPVEILQLKPQPIYIQYQ
jgi:hypothetical protein